MLQSENRDRRFFVVPLAMIAVLLLVYVIHSSVAPPQQQRIESAQSAADAKRKEAVKSNLDDPNWWVAGFTGFLILLTGGQIWLNWRTDKHFRVTERAYVKMSHLKPGIDRYIPEIQAVSLKIQVKNFGRTPARTKTISVQALVVASLNEIPERPRYTERYSGASFLVAEDYFFNGVRLSVLPRDWAEVKAGRKHLLIYGYVDYLDQFDVEHRAGYGRRYEPQIDVRPADATDKQWEDRNNLHFLADRLGYNYDLPLSAMAWTDGPNEEREVMERLAALNQEYEVLAQPDSE